MARKYTPEQEIINLRGKGEITHKEANRRIAALGDKDDAGRLAATRAATVKRKRAKRPLLRKIREFFKRK